MISSKENDMKEEIYQGYQQLAFGSIADAIKLLFMELSLIHISEPTRP